MFRTIMVPLDRSRFGELALPTAIHLAKRHAADLLLVTVWQPIPTPNDDSAADREIWRWEESCREDDRRYMDDLACRVKEASGRPVSVRYLLGEPGDELAKLAASGEVNLAVLSAHARRPLARTVLRSVSERLARKGGIPLLLVRPDDSKETQIGPRRPFQNVLMPLDGSELGEGALDPDFLAGLDFRATTITLLRVVLPPGLSIALEPLPAGAIGKAGRGEVGSAEAYLTAVAERLAPWGFRVLKQVLRSSAIAESIVTFAENNRVDLIAMATHGRGGLARILPGSVADAVFRNAKVPTLLFPPTATRKEVASRRGAAVPW